MIERLSKETEAVKVLGASHSFDAFYVGNFVRIWTASFPQ